jgi:hypothetical protein
MRKKQCNCVGDESLSGVEEEQPEHWNRLKEQKAALRKSGTW